ncbi:RNA polymerase sigma factor [Actinospongicola halichondriae]|uniref:RNA polymerase sigma factor n=1 Tax=Actinospongicola halichondriae TaxID=3236844 RepID=UPI003D3B8347
MTAFEAFYRTEYRPLLRLAWSLTGRKDLGEELVQETMLTVHGRWADVGSYDKPGGYARRVLLNAATSAARRKAAEKRAVQRLEAQTDPVRLAPEPPPDETFWAALRALPERQAQAIALHYVEDRSVESIAEILDIAPNTVKVHLHRGRLALAESLRPEEEER